jgi:hypothetical protein
LARAPHPEKLVTWEEDRNNYKMKYVLLFFSFAVLSSFINRNLETANNKFGAPTDNYELKKEEVKAMLGETALVTYQKDSTGESLYLRKSRTYTVDIKDNNEVRISNLYYAYERHASIEIADALIDSYFASNKNSPGYQQLSGYGDEGFFHTDGENFCTFVARKGKVFIRLKINKLTSKSDPEELKRIGKQLLSRV